ncbi:MAG: DUF1570 domain-containing protein [Anaeromyxobacteraceae bacterium]
MTPRPAAALAVLLATSVPARAAAGDWKCSAKGGREWRELSTEHFRVATDLSSGAAKDLAVELETMHAAVRGALFRTPPPMPGLVRVVAFRSEEDYRAFAPDEVDAYFAISDGRPTVVMHGEFAEYTRIVVAHELGHQLLARVFPRQPRWFSEGLACYLETVGLNGPDATPTVGGVPPHRHRTVYPYHGGIGEVLRARDGLADHRQYGLAWALVHYLIQARGAEFGQFQARLGKGEDPAAAWLAVFPKWDPASEAGMEDLDREVGHHVAGGRFAYRTVTLQKDHAVSERPLPPAEVHALRARLPAIGAARSEGRAAAEFKEALAEDPVQLEGLRFLAEARGADGKALARKAVEAHPGSERAWLLAARFADDAAATEKALRRAVELAPDDVESLVELAWFLVRAEREGEALPHARKAAFLAPWSAPVLDTYAGALQGLGQCPEALATERRAVDVLSEHASMEERMPYYERLSALVTSCGPKPAAKP